MLFYSRDRSSHLEKMKHYEFERITDEFFRRIRKYQTTKDLDDYDHLCSYVRTHVSCAVRDMSKMHQDTVMDLIARFLVQDPLEDRAYIVETILLLSRDMEDFANLDI